MSTRPEDFDINKVIEYLQGTCMNSLQDGVEMCYPGMDEEDLTDDDLSQFDNELFICETCGWWCEISEQCAEQESCSNQQTCSDCCQEQNHQED